MRPVLAGSRAGFSLIEALVVLAIAGMALMLVFAMGGRAEQLAFRLGGRALDVADGQLGEAHLRTLFRAMVLPPAGLPARAGGGEAFEGGPEGFRGDAVLARATPCAAAGRAEDLRVAIRSGAEGDTVVCWTAAGAEAVLMELAPRRARFAYSTDGLNWQDRWSPGEIAGPTGVPHAQTLLIRLATRDGQVEILDRASSGRPALSPARPAALPGKDVGL